MRHLKAYKIFESNLKPDAPRAPYRFGAESFPKLGKAYHLTPDISIDEIKRVGLEAKTENKLENHPERVYLFLNSDDKKAYKYLAASLWHHNQHKGKIKNYYLLEIDLAKLPGHRYFTDPASGISSWSGIYTEQSIPPSVIKIKEKIPVGSLPEYSDEDGKEDLKDETYRKTGFWPKKKELEPYKPKEKTPEEIKKEKEEEELSAMVAKLPGDAGIWIDPKRLEGK